MALTKTAFRHIRQTSGGVKRRVQALTMCATQFNNVEKVGYASPLLVSKDLCTPYRVGMSLSSRMIVDSCIIVCQRGPSLRYQSIETQEGSLCNRLIFDVRN